MVNRRTSRLSVTASLVTVKSPILIACFAAFSVVLFLTGCSTFSARAREKSAVYDALPARTQQRLERGKINVGDTQDMVYIALGEPDEKRDVATAAGHQSIWVYKTYWQQYEGSAWVGWHRVIVPAGDGRHFAIYHEPITEDIYRTHLDEVIRVTFADNIVGSVEQQKR